MFNTASTLEWEGSGIEVLERIIVTFSSKVSEDGYGAGVGRALDVVVEMCATGESREKEAVLSDLLMRLGLVSTMATGDSRKGVKDVRGVVVALIHGMRNKH
jgi:hypothetical protein